MSWKSADDTVMEKLLLYCMLSRPLCGVKCKER